MKTLSVILPNYNHAAYLSDCLDAILTQSRPPLEIIVIDDASTDRSIEVILKYQTLFPNIRLVRNEKNKGVVASVNSALGEAKGDYLAFCAADDIVLPGFFESTLSLADQHPALGICFGDPCRFSGVAPYRFQRISLRLGNQTRIIYPAECVPLLWEKSFWIASHAGIYKRELVLEQKGLNGSLKHLCDWYLNYQIALKHPIGYIPRPLGALRIIENSFGSSVHRTKRLRNEAFANLMNELEHGNDSKMRASYLRSGLLGQLGISMIQFLAASPRYWAYFPRALKKKCQFFFNKAKCRLFSSEHYSIHDLKALKPVNFGQL